MEKQELINIFSNLFKARSEVCGVEMAFLYGSWAGGHPREDSDIDIAILFLKEKLTEEETFNRILTLEWEFSQRLKKEVNILLLCRDFRKPLLYYNAIVQGTLLYARDYESYIALSIEALCQMEDYSLFGIPWQIEMAHNNLEALQGA